MLIRQICVQPVLKFTVINFIIWRYYRLSLRICFFKMFICCCCCCNILFWFCSCLFCSITYKVSYSIFFNNVAWFSPKDVGCLLSNSSIVVFIVHPGTVQFPFSAQAITKPVLFLIIYRIKPHTHGLKCG